MIVLGADTHKRSHSIAAVAAATGELLGEQTVQVGRRGFDAARTGCGRARRGLRRRVLLLGRRSGSRSGTRSGCGHR